MTAPYTAAELAAISVRAEAATEGPWSRKAMGGMSMVTATIAPPGNRSVGVAFDGERNGYSIALPFFVERTMDAQEYYRPDLVEMSHVDAAFIAAARSDVPRLVAELTRARAALREGLALANACEPSEGDPDYAKMIDAVRRKIRAALGV